MRLKKISSALVLIYLVESLLLIAVFMKLIDFKSDAVAVENYFYLTNSIFELGDDIDLSKYIVTNYVILEIPKIKNVVGIQSVNFSVEKEGTVGMKTVNIEVKDTKAPQIVIGDKHIKLSENDNFNLRENVKVIDNDENVQFYLDYTSFHEGVNDIKVIAVDRSFNQAEAIFQVEFSIPTKEHIEVVKVKEVQRTIQSNNENLKFLFSDGYNMKSAYDKCYEYLSSSQTGSCVPLKNENNIYLGYEFIP